MAVKGADPRLNKDRSGFKYVKRKERLENISLISFYAKIWGATGIKGVESNGHTILISSFFVSSHEPYSTV